MLQDIEGENSWPSPETIEKLATALKIDEGRLFKDSTILPSPGEALAVLRKTLEAMPSDFKFLWDAADEEDRELALAILRGEDLKEKTKRGERGGA